MEINLSLARAGRQKMTQGSSKMYLAVLIYRSTTRPLHGLFKQADKAQKYAESVLKKWRELHG